MFDIEYRGGNSVVIATKKATLVVDGKLSVAGGKDVSIKDAIQLGTEERFLVDGAGGRLTFEGPGEYEVLDFSIRGIAATRHIDTSEDKKRSTVYRIEVGDVRIALLGNIAAKLSDSQLEALGVVDIVIIPVGGGGYTLDATSAAGLVRQIDPKAVIPVHYADNTLTYEVPQDGLDVFVAELGATVETAAKLKIKSHATLPSTLTVYELTRS